MESLFAIIARDASDSEALRTQHRDGHLAHFAAHAARIAVAGPLRGQQPGSLVIYRAQTAAEAEAFITSDPFHAAGVWSAIEIAPFKAASGTWQGA